MMMMMLIKENDNAIKVHCPATRGRCILGNSLAKVGQSATLGPFSLTKTPADARGAVAVAVS